MTCRATWPAVRTNLMLRVTLFAVLALAYAEEAALPFNDYVFLAFL